MSGSAKPLTAYEFFERLTWDQFRRKLEETLRNPDASVPTKLYCPAVMDLFQEIAQNLGESAIQKKGEPLTTENIFTLDQRMVLARILETLVRMAEENSVSLGGQIEGYPS